MKLDVCWFILASVFSLLGALEAGTTAYYLLNWREFWNDIVVEVKQDMGEEFDQETTDRVYKNFEDYDYVGYIVIGVAALWLLCALLTCFYAGSYKRFLREQAVLTAAVATSSVGTQKIGNRSSGVEQPRGGGDDDEFNRDYPTDTRTMLSDLSFNEQEESVV
jgi:hypothetical protein